MRQFLLAATLFTALSCKQGASSAQSIPVIGLNQKGQSTLNHFPKEAFKNKMSSLISGITDQVSSSLENHQTSDKIPWTLSRVTVGLGIETEFEVIEDVIEAEVESDIELRFQKLN